MIEREKRLTDYGVPPEDCKWIYQKCQELTTMELLMLTDTASLCCPAAIVNDIVLSLTDGVSYYVLRVIGRAQLSKNDFYAYRRKTVATFYHILKGD